ncbi:Hypothetical predicted protein [Mytilus galloprovincialis]|uniref:Uncharacterized protein n=1 Tax=Mytilus galloprovincialis TaxID=29158 RepID=A0A8B6F4E9_MYTGA|nr:Hypothetical predicted protein [Mytilus galloprovincialis]
MGLLLQTDKEIEEEAKTMQFIADNGSESRLFTFLKKQRTKKDDIFKKIKDIQHTSRIKISLEEASHEIKAIKAIGFLSVHYEMVKSRRPDIPLISKHGLNDLAQTVSNQSTQNTSSIARIPKFPMLKEALQIKLDPKDFVDRNDKYAKLNLRKVWIAVNDGNCLFVAGHVTILEEHTEKNEYSKYKNNYRLVKYVYNDKGLTFINGWNICCDQYYRDSFNHPSMNIAFSCIPKSAQAVLLHNNNFNLIDTETMERQWCLKLDHQFEALATDEKFIYISTKGLLYKYNCIGFLVERINFIHCDSFALSLNGNFACHSDIFRLLRDDGSEIFSYHPVGLKTVTADKTGNIYLATEDGIQLIELLKMETAMVFRYEKDMCDGLMGVVCDRDENLQFLHGKMSDKSEEFGQYLERRDISSNRDARGYYLCDKCSLYYCKKNVSTLIKLEIDSRNITNHVLPPIIASVKGIHSFLILKILDVNS